MLKYDENGKLTAESVLHLAQGHVAEVTAHLAQVQRFIRELSALMAEMPETEVEKIRQSPAYQEMQAELKSSSGHG